MSHVKPLEKVDLRSDFGTKLKKVVEETSVTRYIDRMSGNIDTQLS